MLDCGAVTAEIGVDTEESEAALGDCAYGPEMEGCAEGEAREEAERFVKRRCNEGFLSLRARDDEAESGVGGGSADMGEKLGRVKIGVDRFSKSDEWGILSADGLCGNWIDLSIGIGSLMTGRGAEDRDIGAESAIIGEPAA